MNIATTLATGLTIVIVAVALALLALGADRFWRFFGDPDLGPVSFEQLVRRTSPNDALAKPAGLGMAAADITTRLYPISARDLRAAFTKVLATEPRVTRVEGNEASLVERYIQRSALLGYPDTIVVRFFERPDGSSTLALYSRSQFGHSDLGVNKARLERWLAKLATLTPPAP